MTFVADLMPRPAQVSLAAAVQGATLLFAWLLGSRGWALVRNNWDVENVAVPFNLGVVYLIEPIAAFCIALYAVMALASLRKGAA